jgi:hypothetical protein
VYTKWSRALNTLALKTGDQRRECTYARPPSTSNATLTPSRPGGDVKMPMHEDGALSTATITVFKDDTPLHQIKPVLKKYDDESGSNFKGNSLS